MPLTPPEAGAPNDIQDTNDINPMHRCSLRIETPPQETDVDPPQSSTNDHIQTPAQDTTDAHPPQSSTGHTGHTHTPPQATTDAHTPHGSTEYVQTPAQDTTDAHPPQSSTNDHTQVSAQETTDAHTRLSSTTPPRRIVLPTAIRIVPLAPSSPPDIPGDASGRRGSNETGRRPSRGTPPARSPPAQAVGNSSARGSPKSGRSTGRSTNRSLKGTARSSEKRIVQPPGSPPRTGRSDTDKDNSEDDHSPTRERKARSRSRSGASDISDSILSSVDGGSSGWSSLTVKQRWFSEDGCLAWVDDIKPPLWYQKLRPRRRQVLWCAISELIIAATLFVQYHQFRQGVRSLNLNDVNKQVLLMKMTYNRKLDEIELLAKSWTQNEDVIRFMKKQADRPPPKLIANFIAYDLNYLQAEYGLLVDTNATILVDVNLNRTGTFDPDGVVSKVVQHPEPKTYHAARLLSYDAFVEGKLPVYREVYSKFVDTALTHPFDTRAPSLCRYVVVPIFEHSNGTGALLGAAVAGDITNGKTPITYLGAKSLGEGFNGLYTEDGHGGYIRSSSSVVVQGKSVDVSNKIHTYSTYDPITPRYQRMLLERAKATPTKQHSVQDGSMAWAALTAPSDTWDGVAIPKADPPAVMVRGMFLNEDPVFSTLWTNTWYYLVALLVVNVISTYVSTDSFIRPIEDLARNLKRGLDVDLSGAGNLKLYAKFLFRLCVTLAIAVTSIVFISKQMDQSMSMVVMNLTTSQIGASEISYNLLVDQMSQMLRHHSNTKLFRDFAQNQTDPVLLAKVKKVLALEKGNRKLEFLVVVGTKLKAVAAISDGAYQVTYNPVNVVSDTFATHQSGLRFKRSGYIDYDTFNIMHPAIYEKHLIPGIPDSKYGVYCTKKDAFVRWASAPIYGTNNVEKVQADAVMVAGDLVNGKTALCERMLLTMEHGLVALYGIDRQTNDTAFYLLCSVMIDYKTRKGYSDIEVDQQVIWDSYNSNGQKAVRFSTVNGKPYVLSAMQVPFDRAATTQFGQVDLKTRAHAYYVFGKDRAVTEHVQKTQKWLVTAGAFIQLLMMLMVSYFAYAPFKKLLLVLEEKGLADVKNHPTTWRVLQVYVIDYTYACYLDLRSRPLSESFHIYVIVRGRKFLRRIWRSIHRAVWDSTHHKRKRSGVGKRSISVSLRPVAGSPRHRGPVSGLRRMSNESPRTPPRGGTMTTVME